MSFNGLSQSIDRRQFFRIAALAGTTLVTGSFLAGCSSEDSRSAQNQESDPSETAGQNSTQDAAQESQDAAQESAAHDTLVAVFSWSGNTLQVAERINELVPSDFFRIEPATPYSTDYNTVLDVAQQEQDEDARPQLAATVDAWDSYGTIYLGYPVWWYDAPQIIKSFLDQHDTSGKLIIPFCTSGGSSIDQTLPSVQELCPNATFAEGITLDGDTVSSHLSDVDHWLGDLGLR